MRLEAVGSSTRRIEIYIHRCFASRLCNSRSAVFLIFRAIRDFYVLRISSFEFSSSSFIESYVYRYLSLSRLKFSIIPLSGVSGNKKTRGNCLRLFSLPFVLLKFTEPSSNRLLKRLLTIFISTLSYDLHRVNFVVIAITSF